MRLVTRSDFDGLICAAILKEAHIIDKYQFVHPKDVQDGRVLVNNDDVLANIPYFPGCGMWFDHHSSEQDSLNIFELDFVGESRPEKSCARIIYEYYGGQNRFPHFQDMIEAVDKSDSGNLTKEEIESPGGWILLSFIMDPRTGLGTFKDYRISNYRLMEDLVEYCRTRTIDEILEQPDVKERISRYLEHQEPYQKLIIDCAEIKVNSAVVIDMRNVEQSYVGNRFIEYTIFPYQNLSIRMLKGKTPDITVFAVGHSVINRTSKTDVGKLMREYGGGGHSQVGTCQVPSREADSILLELILRIKKDEEAE